MKILVLGLGNELYGDDAVGIHVVRRAGHLKEKGRRYRFCRKDVDLVECSLTGLKLLDVIEGYDGLIIIDTIKRPHPRTGRISVLDGAELRHIPGPSPHYVSVPQMIEMGKQIGLKVPSRVKVIAVEAKNLYNLGEGLTEEMERAIPGILHRLDSILDGWEQEEG